MINDRRAKVRARKSRLAKSGLLGASLPWTVSLSFCVMASTRVKSLSGSLGILKMCEKFPWQVVILEQNRKKFWAFLNRLAILLSVELLKL